jgi:hypothetical protein
VVQLAVCIPSEPYRRQHCPVEAGGDPRTKANVCSHAGEATRLLKVLDPNPALDFAINCLGVPWVEAAPLYPRRSLSGHSPGLDYCRCQAAGFRIQTEEGVTLTRAVPTFILSASVYQVECQIGVTVSRRPRLQQAFFLR